MPRSERSVERTGFRIFLGECRVCRVRMQIGRAEARASHTRTYVQFVQPARTTCPNCGTVNVFDGRSLLAIVSATPFWPAAAEAAAAIAATAD